jgi:hypothetical protein
MKPSALLLVSPQLVRVTASIPSTVCPRVVVALSGRDGCPRGAAVPPCRVVDMECGRRVPHTPRRQIRLLAGHRLLAISAPHMTPYMMSTERSFLLTSTISNSIKHGFDQVKRSRAVMEDHGPILICRS